MSTVASLGSSNSGVLHEYAPRLVAFEFTSPTSNSKKPHSLIFVGGLTDGLCTVPYVSKLAKALENTEWSLFSLLLTSSYNGFGTSSLDKDVEEISKCVHFVKELKADQVAGPSKIAGKIAVMGHSTGSQDVLHYLYAPNPLSKPEFDVGLDYVVRPKIDGAIMQAAVSDREVILDALKSANHQGEVTGAYKQLVNLAKTMPWTHNGKDAILPMDLTAVLGLPGDAPLSARRFLSLASPDSPDSPSEDDLFSSDLSDKRLEQTFGKIGTRGLLGSKLCVLQSANDEFCPSWIDKEALMERWKSATEAGGIEWDTEASGIVPGASHNVQDLGQEDLIERILRYLSGL
ncbi:Fusarinine C esterase sidJ [Penicillium diatomitis]|uniref:Fusarinine C esterase sidJ n=1 Tax=Penicillium diatomitis TaxID=2819901 RepID=A0A9W9XHN6_9EURO|nr:Fusarinine C esterase sidJ [Penicillium diatomitis]KAJ5493188.1 Fusarinine C esterase sidJ [Penicillium diatomitis]